MKKNKQGKSNMVFKYKDVTYPSYIKEGNAASYVIPFAQHYCKGDGLDIGGFFDWTFPGAKPVNILLEDEWDAYNLPKKKYDYIFSSHTLEHLPDYVGALEYWKGRLKKGGVLFLYIPHPDMEYWLPQNNRKHLHSFYPEQLVRVLKDIGFRHVLHSERDLYWSFTVVGILP